LQQRSGKFLKAVFHNEQPLTVQWH